MFIILWCYSKLYPMNVYNVLYSNSDLNLYILAVVCSQLTQVTVARIDSMPRLWAVAFLACALRSATSEAKQVQLATCELWFHSLSLRNSWILIKLIQYFNMYSIVGLFRAMKNSFFYNNWWYTTKRCCDIFLGFFIINRWRSFSQGPITGSHYSMQRTARPELRTVRMILKPQEKKNCTLLYKHSWGVE